MTNTEVVWSVKNQYFGINAHLHSLWQGIGRWNRFHNVHIAQLMMSLKAQLLPMGYTAEIEESLQIRRFGDMPRQPVADILISDLQSRRRKMASLRVSPSGAQTLTIEELIEEDEDREHPYSAVAIYHRSIEAASGEPIAWLELLSPSNKGASMDARAYRAKRKELLRGGMVFVELDYLHETPPTFWTLPDYTQHEPSAHPYRVVVLDPRPEYQTGAAQLYEFDVDVAIPTAVIPLSDDDQIEFNFDSTYQKTFEDALYGHDVDYRLLPMNFERYSEVAQAHIAARMVTILEATQNGIGLESGPFPIKSLSLNEALSALQTLLDS